MINAGMADHNRPHNLVQDHLVIYSSLVFYCQCKCLPGGSADNDHFHIRSVGELEIYNFLQRLMNNTDTSPNTENFLLIIIEAQGKSDFPFSLKAITCGVHACVDLPNRSHTDV